MSTLAFAEFLIGSALPRLPQIRFMRAYHFEVSAVRTLLRPASLLAPLNGPDRIAPAIGDFYFWASSGSVTLPAPRYDFNSDWTPLLAGPTPAGMAASLAAPRLGTRLLARLCRGRHLRQLSWTHLQGATLAEPYVNLSTHTAPIDRPRP